MERLTLAATIITLIALFWAFAAAGIAVARESEERKGRPRIRRVDPEIEARVRRVLHPEVYGDVPNTRPLTEVERPNADVPLGVFAAGRVSDHPRNIGDD